MMFVDYGLKAEEIRRQNRISSVTCYNYSWARDFMHDALYCGKRVITLNIMDKGARKSLHD